MSDSGVVVADQQNGGLSSQNGGTNDQQTTGAHGESLFAICKTLIVRAMLIYFITSLFRRPAPQQTPGNSDNPAAPRLAANLFENGTWFDLHVFVSESEQRAHASQKPVWLRRRLQYGDWTSGVDGDGIHDHQLQFEPSQHVQNNGSLYLHVYVVRAGLPLNMSAEATVHRCKRLSRFRRIKRRRTHNLLTGVSEQADPSGEQTSSDERDDSDDAKDDLTMAHWHPNITISLVVDFTGWSRASLVPPLDEYVEFMEGTRGDPDRYKPIVFINDYWNLARDYQPVNQTVSSLPLHITFQPIGLVKFQLYSSMNMRNKWMSSMTGGSDSSDSDDDEQDSLKEALLTTNVYLMALTVFVSLLHSVFEFLAFKNDVQFWRRRESLEGLSVRTVVFGVFQALVVLLYVLDNDTNTMIRVSCAIGLLIELWKVGRVTDVVVQWRAIAGCLPRVTIADKSSYVESSTRHYDQLAFRYVSWLVFPLFAGYTVYSLLYSEHPGWYSFVLSVLYGFLLTFGFIMMTPQLFINYKLKSVAHLPWRMLTYKALNTFIDDIFAFVIRMPMMYRIGCLRDDIVFFIYLYQRYIYRVDPSRVNEFGYSQHMLNEDTTAPVSGGEDAGTSPSPSDSSASAAVAASNTADKKND